MLLSYHLLLRGLILLFLFIVGQPHGDLGFFFLVRIVHEIVFLHVFLEWGLVGFGFSLQSLAGAGRVLGVHLSAALFFSLLAFEEALRRLGSFSLLG
jgi:hypothetical protein